MGSLSSAFLIKNMDGMYAAGEILVGTISTYHNFMLW